MKAQAGKTYAIIVNNEIVEIFTAEKYPAWDEKTLQVIELSDKDLEHVGVGSQLDSSGNLMPYNLEVHKYNLLSYINEQFTAECVQVKGQVPSDEQYTWEIQKQEAAKFIASKNADDAPLLAALAKARGLSLENLAAKVQEKNTLYTQAITLLVGNRQALEDKITASKSKAELDKITYTSPLQNLAQKG